MAEIRERLLRSIAIDMAFEGDSDDILCIGLPDGDCDTEYFLLHFASHLAPDLGTGTLEERATELERSRKLLRIEFQRLAQEHEGAPLTKAELNWLMHQAGAIVTDDDGSGMVVVDFYGNSIELDRAWQEHTMEVARVNQEEYGTDWARYRASQLSTALGHVNVAPHFKIRRD